MTKEQSHEIYDLLVAGWAAQECWRENFVHSFVNEGCNEYRCGWGKFYREPNCWRVGCYAEDQAEHAAKVSAINRVLSAMFARSQATPGALSRVSQ